MQTQDCQNQISVTDLQTLDPEDSTLKKREESFSLYFFFKLVCLVIYFPHEQQIKGAFDTT